MKNDLIVACKTHPKYKAIQKPRADCRVCWILYYYVRLMRDELWGLHKQVAHNLDLPAFTRPESDK